MFVSRVSQTVLNLFFLDCLISDQHTNYKLVYSAVKIAFFQEGCLNIN